jgi:hypothetical protein
MERKNLNITIRKTSRTLHIHHPRRIPPLMFHQVHDHHHPEWNNHQQMEQAVNIMIEKDPGAPLITRLRIIHPFEADLNLFLKLQWGSRLVKHAVKHNNLLNDGQHGSVPKRTSMDPVLLTQLTTDLCRILKHNVARFDNDASACNDRIIVNLGMLAARRCGMPPNAIKIHADCLKFMKAVYHQNYTWHIRTELQRNHLRTAFLNWTRQWRITSGLVNPRGHPDEHPGQSYSRQNTIQIT